MYFNIMKLVVTFNLSDNLMCNNNNPCKTRDYCFKLSSAFCKLFFVNCIVKFWNR